MANETIATKCRGVRGPLRIMRMPILSTTTFYEGDYLISDSTGVATVYAAEDNPVAATSGMDNRVLGRALEDSHDENGTRKASASFIVAQPGTQFELPIYAATAANAVAIPADQLLVSYELYNVNGVPSVDIGETTDVKGQIVDFNQEDLPTWPAAITAGTQLNPRVWFEFLPAHSLTAIAS
jgi:hypothetical protein